MTHCQEHGCYYSLSTKQRSSLPPRPKEWLPSPPRSRGPGFHCDQNDRRGFIFAFGLRFLRGSGRSAAPGGSVRRMKKSLVDRWHRAPPGSHLACLFICHLRSQNTTTNTTTTAVATLHHPGHRRGVQKAAAASRTALGKERSSQGVVLVVLRLADTTWNVWQRDKHLLIFQVRS